MKLLSRALLVSLLLLVSCALKKRVEPVPETFLEGSELESTIEEVPFQHAWMAPRDTEVKYTSVFIRPVRTDLIPADSWQRSRGLAVPSQDEFERDAAVLARYFRIRLLSELSKVPNGRFKIAESPGADTLIVEVAFTELVLSEPVIRVLALAAPVPGVDVALSAFSDPHVAFAAKFLAPDGKTLLGTVADRRFPPLRVIDLNKLRARSSAREIISDWSRELAESIQLEELSHVERSSWFSFWLW